MEVWRDIKGYEDLYQVSSLGRIKSFAKWKENGNGGFWLKESIKKNHISKRGYIVTDLYKNKKRKTWAVHRLIAVAFIPNLENKPYINHKNGIKTDNRIENLEWCTCGENHSHAYTHGLKTAVQGEKSNFAKLNQNEVFVIRKLLEKTSLNKYQIAEIFNVSHDCILYIETKRTWKNN